MDIINIINYQKNLRKLIEEKINYIKHGEKKKNKLLDERIEFLDSELWWKGLNDKGKKEMTKRYKTADIAKKRYWRWMEPIGYKTTTTKNISILEKKFKASK